MGNDADTETDMNMDGNTDADTKADKFAHTDPDTDNSTGTALVGTQDGERWRMNDKVRRSISTFASG